MRMPPVYSDQPNRPDSFGNAEVVLQSEYAPHRKSPLAQCAPKAQYVNLFRTVRTCLFRQVAPVAVNLKLCTVKSKEFPVKQDQLSKLYPMLSEAVLTELRAFIRSPSQQPRDSDDGAEPQAVEVEAKSAVKPQPS